MKKIKIILAAILAVAIAGLAINGCKKDQPMSPATTTNSDASLRTMYDNSTAEASYDDAGNVAVEGINGSLNDNRLSNDDKILTSCAAVTFDLFANPHKATIDFGNTDCLGKDGNYRRGKIIVTWTGDYDNPGSVFTVTFDGYYLNFNKIEGTRVITNKGRNADGNLTFSVTVSGTITIDAQYSPNGDGGMMTYHAVKTREWIEGEHTPRMNDDIYLVTGNAYGTGTDGVSYTAVTDIKAPLKREIGFPHFTSGILIITRMTPVVSSDASSNIISVDYSYLNGQRDDLARVTANGNTYTVHLDIKPR